MVSKIRNSVFKSIKQLSPMRIMGISFLLMILLCTALLSLPCCYVSGTTPPLIDVLFISTSAVCITGLTTLNVATDFTAIGQWILLLVIQIGGLGMVTFTVSLLVLLGGRLGLRQRRMLLEYLPGIELASIVRVTRYIVLAFILIELLGALVLACAWVPIYGWSQGLFHSLFHSVASLCNAGISTIPNGLITYRSNVIVNLTVMALVVVGGLGYVIIFDVINFVTGKGHIASRHRLHIHIVLITNLVLIIAGAFIILLFERNNTELVGCPLGEAFITAFFQSITCRSCGYNTIDISTCESYTKFFMMGLMFIGGATGSTASGIKVTTFALLIMATWTHIHGKRDIEMYGRRIPWARVTHATSLTVIAFFTVCFMIVVLNYLEPTLDASDLMFDTVSALGTVGLSTGIPQMCGIPAKLVLCLCMFLGRLGPFTVALSLISAPKPQHTTYPEGNILIG